LRLGVLADAVVGAGSIMVKQPAFRAAFASGLAAQEVTLPLSVLDTEPVLGAVRLANLALRNDASCNDEEQLT
ncbi:hypothetical protein ACFQ08_36935, partial [Streptosporangium algeriense]